MKHSAFCIEVIDGDTLLVELKGRQEKVRLLGIDTPELADHRKGNVEEIGAYEATTFMRRSLEGLEVFLKHEDHGDHERDKHGRLLAYVSNHEYSDIQAELVSNGLARVYRYFKFTRQKYYFDLENEARRQKLGIWGK